jgi:hypothetical protein
MTKPIDAVAFRSHRLIPYEPEAIFQAFARPELLVHDLQPPAKVVIHHVSKPRYVLTITLAGYEQGTAITWTQEFEDASVAGRIRHIVEPANEQNLDRLESVLAAAERRR